MRHVVNAHAFVTTTKKRVKKNKPVRFVEEFAFDQLSDFNRCRESRFFERPRSIPRQSKRQYLGCDLWRRSSSRRSAIVRTCSTIAVHVKVELASDIDKGHIKCNHHMSTVPGSREPEQKSEVECVE